MVGTVAKNEHTRLTRSLRVVVVIGLKDVTSFVPVVLSLVEKAGAASVSLMAVFRPDSREFTSESRERTVIRVPSYQLTSLSRV
jgi:hypothetical protein